MPGIHVRTSGKVDWVEREKEPVLTVPGSYWLCHKKNIYKFTFKYHRSSKDTKEFNYGKELMKVIRRIIKSQPRQGQQFGTRHLLVTYNHSSWTRQDKMFAMLKFRDKTNATAFPRAFVLIVKILPTNAVFENGNEFDDDLIVYEKSTSRRTQWNTDNKDANEVTQEQRLSSNKPTDLPKNALDNVKSTESVNTPVTRSMRSNQKRTNSASFLAGLDDLPLLEQFLSEQNDPSSSEDNQECLNELQETVDMPYQYLIEREIERTKSRLTDNAQAEESAEKREKRESMTLRSKANNNSANIIDNATARSANITDLVMEGLMFTIRQDQDSVTVVEQKTKLEPDEVLENSEKVETKEGAECLVNSSLLKLENLITKIEMSSSGKGRCEEDQTVTQLNFSAIDVNGNDEVDVEVEEEVEKLKERENTRNSKESTNDAEECTVINPKLNDNINDNPILDSFMAPSPQHRPFMCELSKDVPLVTINVSNVHEVLNDVIKNGCSSSPIHEPIEELENKEGMKDDLGFESSANNDEGEDEEEEEEEDIIPEAFRKSKEPENECDLTDADESNLLMDDIETEKSRPPQNKNGPRIISSEVVQYDLSSLRSSSLRRRLDETNQTSPINEKNVTTSGTPLSRELTTIPEKLEKVNETPEGTAVTTRRRLTARRRLYTHRQEDDNAEVKIEMGKFMRDMTHGVRVVLERLDLDKIPGGFRRNGYSFKCIN